VAAQPSTSSCTRPGLTLPGWGPALSGGPISVSERSQSTANGAGTGSAIPSGCRLPKARTRVELCGRLSVAIDGRPLDDRLPGRQGRMLFAYLVANRARPVTRDELMGALWPDSAPAAPGPSLSTLLARLRAVLGEGKLHGRHELSLRLPPDAWIDLEVMEAEAADAENALTGGNLEAALGAGRDALALAQGPLLPEFSEGWVEERRRELGELKLTILEVCARAGLALGGPELRAAERAARTLVTQSPYRESGYALLMRICAARGDVAEALRVYDKLRVLLHDELGATPSRALVALNDELLRAQTPSPLSRSAERPLPRPLALMAKRTLVGRAAQLAQLRTCWEQQDSEPGFALVSGESGIGKTHLIASFARDARADGATVLAGRCDEEAAGAYQPFVEALNAHLGSVDVAVWDAGLPAERRGLDRLVPGLGARPDERRHRVARAPEDLPTQMFDAVVNLLRDIAGRQPLLVVLDDMQWADKATLLLVRHVLRSLEGVRAMLILAFRAVDAPASPRLAALLADLRRERDIERVSLKGLDENEAAALLRAHGVEDPDEALPRALGRATAGNPFLIVQALRGLHNDPEAGGSPGIELDRPGMLDGVKEFVLRQLSGLDGTVRKLLETASVQGIKFRLEVLERVLGVPAERLLELIEDLIDAGLVAEAPDNIDHFAFRHPLVRDALHGQILASRRWRLERAVARALDAPDRQTASSSSSVDPGGRLATPLRR
jgi:DNA-binding SARP family transcriptional activator/NAD(P)-dependent dehydrogenase (short-subunit alcohol dehydrogenase family)